MCQLNNFKTIARDPRRCQRITVSGLTTAITFRIEGNSRDIQTKISRSMFRRHTRDWDLRLRTITCCRKTRISASSLARDFNRDRAMSRSLVRNANIAPISASAKNSNLHDATLGKAREVRRLVFASLHQSACGLACVDAGPFFFQSINMQCYETNQSRCERSILTSFEGVSISGPVC